MECDRRSTGHLKRNQGSELSWKVLEGFSEAVPFLVGHEKELELARCILVSCSQPVPTS